jgi:protein-disulfide isomerase
VADDGTAAFVALLDVLGSEGRALSELVAPLRRYAGELELDVPRFEQCVADRTHSEAVESDLELGKGLGVSGTPAFFVNGIMLSGSRPVETFAEMIDAELERLNGPESS